MSIAERTGEKHKLHPRFVANEDYLRNPDIVGVKNPNVTPVRETKKYEGRSLSSHVLPDRKPLRRF